MKPLRTVGVGVFVVNPQTGCFLIGKRALENPRGPGILCLPGGYAESGESVMDAAIRETKEETGLIVVPLFPPRGEDQFEPNVLGTSDHTPDDDHTTLWVTTRYLSGTPATVEPHKCGNWIWTSMSDALYMIRKSDEVYKDQLKWTPCRAWASMWDRVDQRCEELREMSFVKLADALAHMILYGDIDEASHPDDFLPVLNETDPEVQIRRNIASTILKLAYGGPGGSCSMLDKHVAPFLRNSVGSLAENPHSIQIYSEHSWDELRKELKCG
jgi:8-oxo-dGTP diphosphatase